MAHVVYKEAIDYLNKIADFSHEYALESLEIVGLSIRKVLMAKARSYPKDKTSFYRYGHKTASGARYMRLRKASYLRNPYERYEGGVRTDDSEPDKLDVDMADLIRSKPYHDLGKVIVGWMDTGSYKTKIKNAKGSNLQKGHLGDKIGRRLEFGGTIQLSERSQRMRWYSGYRGGGRSIRVKAYPVINPSFGASQTAAIRRAHEQYNKLMEKYNGSAKSRSA